MVTSISELRALGTVQEVELPGWGAGETVTFKLGRPSLMLMVRDGRIPNRLLSTAQGLFTGSANAAGGEHGFQDMIDVMLTIVKATLVEPTYDELGQAGITLTDEQMVAIFQYSQNGPRALERFRTKPAHGDADRDERNAQPRAERDT